MDSQAVIKIMRYGINFACFPDEHTVELCERQLAKQKQPQERTTEDFEPEITFILPSVDEVEWEQQTDE